MSKPSRFVMQPLRGEPTSDLETLDPMAHEGGVYVIEGLWPGALKIGKTISFRERMSTLSFNSPHRIRLLAILSTDPSDEAVYHVMWKHLRLHPRREFFESAPDLVRYVALVNEDCAQRALVRAQEAEAAAGLRRDTLGIPGDPDEPDPDESDDEAVERLAMQTVPRLNAGRSRRTSP